MLNCSANPIRHKGLSIIVFFLFENKEDYSMVTLTNTNHPITFYGKSTDTKPTKWGDISLENGDSFVEMDTGDIYFYDEEETDWILPA